MSVNGKGIWKVASIAFLATSAVALSCARPPAPTPAPTATPVQTGAPTARPAGDAAAGEKLFTSQGCAACHQAKGVGGQIGPKLDGLWGSKVKLTNGQEVTADDAYVRESIINPTAKVRAGFQPIMPTTFASLPKQDLDNLIAFISSLPK